MLEIPARIYSKAIWETIRYRTKGGEDTEVLDTNDTRAVSEGTCDLLWRVVKMFKPKVVVEIGTGTGRSAQTMLYAGPPGVTIHTCDTEPFEVDEFDEDDDRLMKFYHGTSTDMLVQLTKPVDLFFFDGRIQPDDIPQIQRLAKPDCTFLFDDFEGVEKGVANALMIQHLGGLLVLPEEGQTLGMMLRTKIGMTRQ